MASASYYDIDDILAQEELIPVTNLLDFTYLAHFDPDYVPGAKSSSGRNSPDDDIDNNEVTKSKPNNHSLVEGTRFRMPLWSIEKWLQVGFVKMSLPKHYGRKMRERMEADPVSFDLRYVSCRAIALLHANDLDNKLNNIIPCATSTHCTGNGCNKTMSIEFIYKIHFPNTKVHPITSNTQPCTCRKRNERYFQTGMQLLNLIHQCQSTNQQFPKTHRYLLTELQHLKQTLLQTYTGARMRRIFDWTLSRIEDDVSAYTEKLTDMEMRLFERGKEASRACYLWKLFGTRRIMVSDSALVMRIGAANAKVNTNRSGSLNKAVKRSGREGIDFGVPGRKKSRAY